MGTPSLPQTFYLTSTQRKAWRVPKNVIVIESGTELPYRGDGVTYGGKAYGLTQQRILMDKVRRVASIARFNNVIDNPAMTSPPSITSAATNSQTNAYYLANSGSLTNQDKVRVVGGVPFVNLSSYLAVKSVSSTTGSNIGPAGTYQNGWYIEFMTAAPTVSIGYYRTAETGVMVAVSENGGPMQYASFTPTTIYGSACGTNNGSVTVTFGSSKIRRVRFEFGNQQVDEVCGAGGVLSVRGIFVDPSYSIWKPRDVDTIHAAIIGDSYTAGAPRDSGMQSVNWSRVLAAKMGWHAVQMALGGTGYSKANGALPAAADPLRLADLVAQPYDVFVFALGTNDVTGNDGTAVVLPDLAAKALTCFQAARAANPIAPIFILGPWVRPTFPPQTQLDQANAVLAAFNSFNDSNSYHVPIYIDSSGNWLPGTSYQGNIKNSADVSQHYFWTDAIHPLYVGHYLLGDRSASEFREKIKLAQ
ncbi:SGNH/GDSL hydrolase family protein [Singulisphaera sp. PoT]|uniref:SGNH/GDSL hydrolase family protein n=1 Tax=Singulisphaera sp. PoT TaxID=3411797 RepID=UPI003BF5DA81